MTRNKIITLSILIAFQLSVIAMMFIKAASIKNYAINHSTIIRIHCTAYDPFHPLKGRYVQLTLNENEIKGAEKLLEVKLNNIQKTANAYYLQEEYALIIDSINWQDFNALDAVLELYVGKDGSVIQKGLYVHHNGIELPIEKYIRDYTL